MQALQILEHLSDGAFHSGQKLAQELGVTRAAIWKQVGVLTELGLPVERVRGKGYRITGGVELLGEAAIIAGLSGSARSLVEELTVFPKIDSTNAELARRPKPARGAAVALAEYQSAGRGRRGRRWISPFGSSIYCSVAWTFQGGAEALQGLSLAVGVCLCDALESLGVTGLALKWPNDVLCDDSKLAGILVEMSGDASGPCTAIIGVGVNLRLPEQAAREIDQRWSDLGDRAPSRNALAVAYLERLLELLADYEARGFAAWRSRWQRRDAFAGRSVTLESAGRITKGVADGVDERGALLLHTDTGVMPVHGGEVSLRPASG